MWWKLLKVKKKSDLKNELSLLSLPKPKPENIGALSTTFQLKGSVLLIGPIDDLTPSLSPLHSLFFVRDGAVLH